MPLKQYTQKGTFSVMVILPILILCIVMLFISGFGEPLMLIMMSFIILTFIVCLLIFFKLTISIDDTHLTFTMGIGLIRKSYPLSDIAGCIPVRNSAIWGIGIRLVPSGWLYSVSGLDAIELSFKSSNKKIRIGTNKPVEIAGVINENINCTMTGSYYEKGGHGGLYLMLILLVATILFPVTLITYGSRETEISFSDSTMTISTMYGLTVNYADIMKADTLQSLPGIRARTNGFATGKILKGHFKLDDRSKVMLFIQRGVPPYIYLKTSGTAIYMNFNSPLKTRDVFRKVKDKTLSINANKVLDNI